MVLVDIFESPPPEENRELRGGFCNEALRDFFNGSASWRTDPRSFQFKASGPCPVRLAAQALERVEGFPHADPAGGGQG